MNKNAPTEATPDELFSLLELQVAEQRQKRKGRPHSRPLVLAGSLLLIIGAAVAALIVLHGILEDVVRNEGRAPAAGVTDSGNF